ncbi:MAG: ABC-F family ATP-binding cassette domain-containing protein [Lentisphaeria bacterium]|nr:ABC-F family ATP-binding cassette domain-containing protein [Lentisphaeria bacterium]
MIDFIGISKSYGARDIFKEISFRIDKGDRVGIVGPNGAGKTTIFKMILGEISADKGEILIPKKARIGVIRQQLDFFREGESLLEFTSAATGELEQTEKEIVSLEKEMESCPDEASRKRILEKLGEKQSVFEAQGGYAMRHRAEAALSGLGFPEESFSHPMESFSGGWQMRACMAKTLLSDPEILLLDEPSNYLDTPAVEWLRKSLKSFPGTILLISHDRFLLNSITENTLEINNGNATFYSGNYSKYILEREERTRVAEAAQENIDRRKEQLERNINRFRAKATKAAQVKSWIKMLDKLEDTDVPDSLHFRGEIRIPEPPRCGTEVVRLEDVTFSYDGRKNILEHVSFSVMRGDKVGFVGYNGMGKSTLLKLIAGVNSPTSGRCVLGHQVVIGYQAQEFGELLPGNKTPIEIVREASMGKAESKRVREILGAFGFSGEEAEKPCSVLSGGEKIRLCFARIFVNPPNLLILDEPTTHLDIAAREALQKAVLDYAGTVCLVSHDIEFLRATAKTIIEMRPPSVRQHYGDYDYYRERIGAEEAAKNASGKQPETEENPDKSAGDSKERRRERARKRQELSKEKRDLEKKVAELEEKITSAEKEKEEIILLLSQPAQDKNFSEARKRLWDLEEFIEKTTQEWEKKASQLEELMVKYREIHED